MGNVPAAARLVAAMEMAWPDDPSTILAAAHLALRRQRYPEAIDRLEKLLQQNERDQSARGLLIQVYQAAGDHQEAAVHWRKYRVLGGVPDLLAD